jgi:hypothetical protein
MRVDYVFQTGAILSLTRRSVHKGGLVRVLMIAPSFTALYKEVPDALNQIEYHRDKSRMEGPLDRSTHVQHASKAWCQHSRSRRPLAAK